MSSIGRSVAIALFVLQISGTELREDRRAAQGAYWQALVTVVATHLDGTPLRGVIRCNGVWAGQSDEGSSDSAESPGFITDARGAVIFNPRVEDGFLRCWAEDRGMRGEVTARFSEHEYSVIAPLVLSQEGN